MADIGWQEGAQGLITVVLTYVGYRGSKLEGRLDAVEKDNAKQETEIARLDERAKAAEENTREIKEDIKTVKHSLQEILSRLPRGA